MEYDIIIIGGGAAGMSAAIYAGRGGMKTLIIEKLSCGGQMMKTYEIDNYPALIGNPTGEEISSLMEQHTKKYAIDFVRENVKEIQFGSTHTVKTRRNTYYAKSVIIASGAFPRKLGAPGEDRLSGAGVSYCAACDGAFFKGKDTAVIGGGNTAFEDALYLSRLCGKVYILNRSQRFRAANSLVDKAKMTENIIILTDTQVASFNGENSLESISTKNTATGENNTLNASGAIVAIGVLPQSELFVQAGIKTDENGFIETDKFMRTSVSGVFAAGDVRNTPLRQVITAAADGAVAASAAINYIERGINR